MGHIMKNCIICYILLGLFTGCKPEKEVTISASIDFNAEKVCYEHFWRSTGFSSADIVFTPSMQLTLNMLGATRNGGITYIRPHYLLNLVGSRGMGTDNTIYNWEKLDKVLDTFVKNDLKLIFELMGNPSREWEIYGAQYDNRYQGQKNVKEGYFTDFEDRQQLIIYKEFITALGKHLMERYGLEEIKEWFFETTNEPDLKHFWKFGIRGFLNYYDACSEGLKEASEELRFGGPGTASGMEKPGFKELLAHCDTGKNYFTGEKGVRIDFISVHRKFKPLPMVHHERDIIDYIRTYHPKFANKPFFNDEADPIAGWSRRYWWRPDPWYASFVVHSVEKHCTSIIDSMNVNYRILSNDNGFMGDWGRRTHFARFIEGEENQGNMNNQFYLVKKPVYTIMSLLTFQGDQRIQKVTYEDRKDHVGIIPSIRENGDIILTLYNNPDIEISYQKEASMQKDSNDLNDLKGKDEYVNIELNNVDSDKYSLIHYRLDSVHGNPYSKWIAMGSPLKPDHDEICSIMGEQEPPLYEPVQVIKAKNGQLTIQTELPASSVSVLILATRTEELPGKVQWDFYESYNGLNNDKMIFMKWTALDNPHILSYDIYMSETENGEYRKVNPQSLIDQGWIHIYDGDATQLYYKIKAVDYWGRSGDYSKMIKVSWL